MNTFFKASEDVRLGSVFSAAKFLYLFLNELIGVKAALMQAE